MKGLKGLFLVLVIGFLTACGGDSDSSYEKSVQIGLDTYTCKSEVAAAQCVVANVTGASDAELIEACLDTGCECSGPTCDVTSIVAADCEATSPNELAEGASCTFAGVTYTCTAGVVSGGGITAGDGIEINDFSVSCK